MTIPIWSIPTAFTIAIFAWAILMPMPRPQGDYDFSGALSAAFRLAVFIILSLVFWLVYFMASGKS